MPPEMHLPRIRPVMQWKQHNVMRLLALGILVFWAAVIWMFKS